ncbi:hypothetical protein RLIN73S_06033 [Rhodanobacter lindaniclasticus]
MSFIENITVNASTTTFDVMPRSSVIRIATTSAKITAAAPITRLVDVLSTS